MEENSETSLLHARIEQYVKSNIYKYTGLNLTQFMEMPREITQWLFAICDTKTRQESQTLSEVQQQLSVMKKKEGN